MKERIDKNDKLTKMSLPFTGEEKYLSSVYFMGDIVHPARVC